MSIWSEATVFIPSPKQVNIKQLLKSLEPNRSETYFNYSYNSVEGSKVQINSADIYGEDFNDLLVVVGKKLKSVNLNWYIHVTSTYYNV